MARSTAATATSRRREYASASAPDGISSVKLTTDQMTNSDEICAVLSPESAKRSA